MHGTGGVLYFQPGPGRPGTGAADFDAGYARRQTAGRGNGTSTAGQDQETVVSGMGTKGMAAGHESRQYQRDIRHRITASAVLLSINLSVITKTSTTLGIILVDTEKSLFSMDHKIFVYCIKLLYPHAITIRDCIYTNIVKTRF